MCFFVLTSGVRTDGAIFKICQWALCLKRQNGLLLPNSHAVGMADAQPLDIEIDFARNPISWSAAWFFVFIVNFIFTAIFEIKNHVKIPWHQKNFIFDARLL